MGTNSKPDRIAIIDAGSSSTRLFVYEYVTENNKQSIRETFSHEISMCITRLGFADEDIDKFFTELLTDEYPYKDKVLKLYILSTAGMRKECELYDQWLHFFVGRFDFKCFDLQLMTIISGHQEALNAWLATNYTLHTIDIDGNKINCKQTVGIIEVGGVSMQIAFMRDPLTEKLSSKADNIYTKSFSKGGADMIYLSCKEPKCYVEYAAMVRPSQFPPMSIRPKVLYARGKSIIKALKDINGDYTKTHLNNLKVTLTDPASKKDYHPRSNAYYTWWLRDKLGVDIKILEDENARKVSWTLGASLDIMVLGNIPEQYDREKDN